MTMKLTIVILMLYFLQILTHPKLTRVGVDEEWTIEDMNLEKYENDKNFNYKFFLVFNKKYKTLEEIVRSGRILSQNIQAIKEHNRDPNSSYRTGVTQFTDMELEELAEKYLDMDMPNKMKLRNLRNNQYNTEEFSQNLTPIDWRSKDIFLTVRDQGECGSCWAFASLGTVEALRAKEYNVMKYLSPQQFIDCDSKEKGCKGGWPSMAYNYAASNGIVSEEDYPYEAKNGNCKESLVKSKMESKIGTHFERCEEEECLEDDFQYNLLKNGPVTIVIDAYNTNFFNYKSGIYNEKCGEPNHAVMLVGYGVDEKTGTKYWIIRNSWGKSWGMDGYGYIKVDTNNYLSCNINRYGFQPTVLN